MDQDYVDQLNDEEKQWLSRFNNEYFGNTLDKNWHKNLHYKSQKKAIYDQTNARNRDMYNKRYIYNEGTGGKENFSLEALINSKIDAEHTNPEEAYVEYIYIKKKMLKFMEEARASGMCEKEVVELTEKIFDLD